MHHLTVANVRFGSLAAAARSRWGVRFTPESGHDSDFAPCPLCANSLNGMCREYDHLCSNRGTIVKIDHVLISHTDATGRNVVPNGVGLVRSMNPIERVLLALPKVKRSGAERIVGPAMHAKTALQLDHCLSDLRLTF